MQRPTPYPYVNDVLGHLLAQIKDILRDRLNGLYLYGSLVTGDFDPASSDIDLLAVVASDLTEAEFQALDQMQNTFVQNQPQWHERIEIAYMSLHALRTFKTERSPIAIISPGEPFHIKDAGNDWLINWYMVREKGVTLFGPPPQDLIEPVSKAEFIRAVKVQAGEWREWMDTIETRPSQAYAIITLCRALYTMRMGEQASKRQAALWAAEELPAWSDLIQKALVWRREGQVPNVDHAATLPDMRRFVNHVIDLIYE